jgi:TRAP-type C4-dicarboxylate transport system permease small subunit
MASMVRKLANTMALLGGLVLLVLVTVTCLSIIGRILNTLGNSDTIESASPFIAGIFASFGPIRGDFEIVEAGMAFAIMAFLPLCQVNRSHAIVEVATSFLSERVNGALALLWETVFAFVMVIIAWRLYVGTLGKMRYGETTFMLQYPVWWGYAACTAAAFVAAFVAVYSVWSHARDLSQNQNENLSVER